VVQRFSERRDHVLAIERVEQAAVLGQWRKAIGGDKPRKRLAWLLDFAYGDDPASMSAEDRSAVRHALSILVHDATEGRWAPQPAEREIYDQITADDRKKWSVLPKRLQIQLEEFGPLAGTIERSRQKVPAQELQDTQHAVREVLEALVGGRVYAPRFSELPLRFARLGPAEIPSLPLPRRRFVVVNVIMVALKDAVVEAALELFARTPPTAVRQCEPDRRYRLKKCGRVFVGERRQKYCASHRSIIRDAQVQAALEKYRSKSGKSKRKGTKK
jgi:hypothetical protein